MKTKFKGFAILISMIALIASAIAIAGTGGGEFTASADRVVGWLEGDLGRLLAVGFLIVGIAMGIVRQTIMAAVPAVAAGLVVSLGPTVISQIVAAVI